jgi:hypothetical protein
MWTLSLEEISTTLKVEENEITSFISDLLTSSGDCRSDILMAHGKFSDQDIRAAFL